jgi:hypothetical protein
MHLANKDPLLLGITFQDAQHLSQGKVS